MLETVFLDAGGVLLFPNWARIETTLARHDVHVTADQLSRAEPRARKQLDDQRTIGTTTDASRGWLFFDLILGRPAFRARRRRRRRSSSSTPTIRRTISGSSCPTSVRPALVALRDHGLRLVVVSNANGTLRAHMDRIGLSAHLDIVIDSCDEGRREARSAALSDCARRAPARARRRRSTSAICIRWMSWARAPPACGRCCSTKPICVPTLTASASPHWASWSIASSVARSISTHCTNADAVTPLVTKSAKATMIAKKNRLWHRPPRPQTHGQAMACARCRTGRRWLSGLPFAKTTSTIFSLWTRLPASSGERRHDLLRRGVDDLAGGGVGVAAVEAEGDPARLIADSDRRDLLRRHDRRVEDVHAAVGARRPARAPSRRASGRCRGWGSRAASPGPSRSPATSPVQHLAGLEVADLEAEQVVDVDEAQRLRPR